MILYNYFLQFPNEKITIIKNNYAIVAAKLLFMNIYNYFITKIFNQLQGNS